MRRILSFTSGFTLGIVFLLTVVAVVTYLAVKNSHKLSRLRKPSNLLLGGEVNKILDIGS